MTTSTTDAEAIARIIDPLAFDVEKQTFCTPAYWKFRSEHAVCTANRILSYLASRREAQEPVAWGAFHSSSGRLYNHCPTEVELDRYIDQVHQSSDSITLRKGPLYTAHPSPAPAGEVERLRAALRIARGYVEDDAKREPSEYDPHEDLKRIDAALNGGRP